jgi:hypothetical protein
LYVSPADSEDDLRSISTSEPPPPGLDSNEDDEDDDDDGGGGGRVEVGLEDCD